MLFAVVFCALIFFVWSFFYFAGRIGREETVMWDGPKNSKAQSIISRQKVMEYLEEFPDSEIGRKFPDLNKTAKATKRYNQLNELREAGEIDEIDYERELAKVLSEIDISEVLKLSQRKM